MKQPLACMNNQTKNIITIQCAQGERISLPIDQANTLKKAGTLKNLLEDLESNEIDLSIFPLNDVKKIIGLLNDSKKDYIEKINALSLDQLLEKASIILR